MISGQTALYRETGRLAATAPFDFHKSLRFLGSFSPTSGEQEMAPDSFTKAISVDGYVVAFRVSAAESNDDPGVRYELFSERPLPADVKDKVAARIAFFLGLDDDLRPFYAIGRVDPCFAPIIERLHGLHHVKFLTLCEIACWAVLAQHRPIAVARPQKQALIERYGGCIEVEGIRYWAFPELERLVGVSPADLAAVVKNERRAEYLSAVVLALSAVDEAWLRTAAYAEAEAWLRGVRGIGAWSAAFILLRGLGRMEQMLFDLKPFLELLPRVYGPGETMERLAQRYGPWFGYWGYYLRAGYRAEG